MSSVRNVMLKWAERDAMHVAGDKEKMRCNVPRRRAREAAGYASFGLDHFCEKMVSVSFRYPFDRQ